ncbi:hypothetical protein CYMTET_22312 [Cymbomonas tetramitiformis]|uniref:Uncharacterized protein n=1 Tax=Cymbomonas tetramitiformis TaxID=36881 RepID=A0AAE0G0F8_9CHLO|nr:hypothetical protein CYMTET_22312 [Cymbomonas tetramitiformis]
MSPSERAKTFSATAVEYQEVRQFGTGRSCAKTEGIRFQVSDDVLDEPNHEGYWMRLDQWNRFRHDTYKDCRDEELQFIPNTTQLSVAPANGGNTARGEANTAFVYTFF